MHPPLWFPWRYVDRGSRGGHVHWKHVHPHLDAALLAWKDKLSNLSLSLSCLWMKIEGVSHLFDAGLVGVQQWPGLYVFGDQFAAHPRDLLPVVQHGQSQMFLRLLLQT